MSKHKQTTNDVAKTIGEQQMYYLRSIKRNLEKLSKIAAQNVEKRGYGISDEVLHDNIDWLDCLIDQHERAATSPKPSRYSEPNTLRPHNYVSCQTDVCDICGRGPTAHEREVKSPPPLCKDKWHKATVLFKQSGPCNTCGEVWRPSPPPGVQTTSDAAEPLPCPFCGHEYPSINMERRNGAQMFSIHCMNLGRCGAKLGIFFTNGDNAIAAWNKRAAPSPPPPGDEGDARIALPDREYYVDLSRRLLDDCPVSSGAILNLLAALDAAKQGLGHEASQNYYLVEDVKRAIKKRDAALGKADALEIVLMERNAAVERLKEERDAATAKVEVMRTAMEFYGELRNYETYRDAKGMDTKAVVADRGNIARASLAKVSKKKETR